jgi:hypothetical protein
MPYPMITRLQHVPNQNLGQWKIEATHRGEFPTSVSLHERLSWAYRSPQRLLRRKARPRNRKKP